MLYWIFYYIFKFFCFIFVPIRILGKENLPPRSGYIIAANHLSYLDPPIIGVSLNRKISYMARDNLFRNKVFAFIIRKGNAFPVKRKTADIGALKEAVKRLRGGCPLLIFPQGSRESVRGQDQVEAGLGFLAVKSNVPVVPVKISGTDQALPPGAKWVKRRLVTVNFGQPVYFTKQDPYPDISRKVMEMIENIPSGA